MDVHNYHTLHIGSTNVLNEGIGMNFVKRLLK